jgi:hypothetical protein
MVRKAVWVNQGDLRVGEERAVFMRRWCAEEPDAQESERP